MLYSLVVITSIIVCLILNFDIIFLSSRKQERKAVKEYRLFIYSIILFFIFDGLWGILYDAGLITLAYIDTDLYFVAMSLSILFWARSINMYLEEKTTANKIIIICGVVFFIFTLVTIIINLFYPILFMFDEDKVYHGMHVRYVLLALQVLMFTISSTYAIVMSRKVTGTFKNRYILIGVFGYIMAFSIVMQVVFPLLPLYSVGCMLGNVLVHTFVSGSERKEYRKSLEDSINKLKEKEKELVLANTLAYTDSLTGAKSKHAYVEMEEKMDKAIAFKKISKFSIVVFDINGLKIMNDTLGHEAGDDYIKSCYKEIADVYQGVTVYRFGGDEFVAVLGDENYNQRHELLEIFEKNIDKNVPLHKAIVSSGMADFDPKVDNTFRAVFIKADTEMYKRKEILKNNY